MHVFLTGGSGLVGSAVAQALAVEGAGVRLLRHRSPVPDGFDVVDGSLANAAELRRALVDVDVVVHAAARIGGTEAELVADNVEGTVRLAEVARAAGVGRFVHLSTAGVYSTDEPRLDVDEDHAVGSDAPYCRSKLESERRGAAAFGAEFVVLRPVTVYRSGPCPIFAAISRLLDAGLPLPHNGAEDTPVDVVHVEDLALSVVSAIRRGHGVYNIAGPRGLGFRALIEAVAERLQVDVRWLPADSDAGFDGASLQAATRPQTVSMDRARRELLYEPVREWVRVVAATEAPALRGG